MSLYCAIANRHQQLATRLKGTNQWTKTIRMMDISARTCNLDHYKRAFRVFSVHVDQVERALLSNFTEFIQ